MVDSSQIPYAIAIDFDGILCQNAYPDIGDKHFMGKIAAENLWREYEKERLNRKEEHK